ncbi:OmpH family outer membrane protein [Neorickettsia findlayensis]|uniref:OmpH family outer membrane protein n=2 Tax=Neorickettsia findlayensis TaxID=2686014 RepID=A0A6P1GCW7_9RICK|nr:OmpH family outer membrane protein [Neorickettsia findlayensis]
MRKLPLLFAALLLSSNLAAADLKIALADVNVIFENSSEASALMEDIKARQAVVREKFISTRTAIEEKYKELEKQRDVLSKEAFDEKAKALSTEVSSAEKDAAKSASEIENDYMSRVEEIGKKVKSFVDDYAVKEKFDLVLNANQVLYHSATVVDITGELVARLNPDESRIESNSMSSEIKSDSNGSLSQQGESKKKSSRGNKK